MNDFTFYCPTRFVFGRDMVDNTGREMAAAGFKKVLVAYGKGSVVRTGVLDRVKGSLERADIEYVEMGGVRPNPEVEWVRSAIETARAEHVDGLLAIGGGSVIDATKAVAFGVPYDGDVWDFFANRLPISTALPIAVVLTIPASGSEASSSCVISNDALNCKRGVNGDAFRPKLSIMDPTLTYSLPPYQTAAGVTDITAHICERYFSGVGPVPVSDNIGTGLIRALLDAAPRALEQPDDYEARAQIMWAGMLAHNDITGCGRALVPGGRAGGWESHGMEHELSAHHPEITHGAGLAVILPAWMRYVWKADPSRFLDFARDVFGIVPDDPADEQSCERVVLAGINRLQEFFLSMGMPRTLGDFGLNENDIEEFIGTLRENKGERFGAFLPIDLDDARAIYRSAF